MILFHHSAIVQSENFAVGLIAPPAAHGLLNPGRKAQYSATDAAWKAGFDAAMEDADLAIAPFHMGLAERDAFTQGVKDALNQIDFEIEEARRQTEAMDEKELDLLLSTMALEYRGAGPGFQD